MEPDKKLTGKQKKFCEEYAVTEDGRIYSVIRKNARGQLIGGIYVKPQNGKNGYLSVNLTISGSRKRLYIHRIVAETFIINPVSLREVNHKDRNKHNNNVDNLEWCNRKYNVIHGMAGNLNRPLSPARHRAILKLNTAKRTITPEKKIQIDLLQGKVSQNEIARRLGLSPQTIMRYFKGISYANSIEA